MVKGGSIVSVEYNAENASGFIKSWDNAYMQNMLHSNGTYPNEYTRYYAAQLLEGQGEGEIDALSGASSSYSSFQKLSVAVVEQARKGDSVVVLVDTVHLYYNFIESQNTVFIQKKRRLYRVINYKNIVWSLLS